MYEFLQDIGIFTLIVFAGLIAALVGYAIYTSKKKN